MASTIRSGREVSEGLSVGGGWRAEAGAGEESSSSGK